MSVSHRSLSTKTISWIIYTAHSHIYEAHSVSSTHNIKQVTWWTFLDNAFWSATLKTFICRRARTKKIHIRTIVLIISFLKWFLSLNETVRHHTVKTWPLRHCKSGESCLGVWLSTMPARRNVHAGIDKRIERGTTASSRWPYDPPGPCAVRVELITGWLDVSRPLSPVNHEPLVLFCGQQDTAPASRFLDSWSGGSGQRVCRDSVYTHKSPPSLQKLLWWAFSGPLLARSPYSPARLDTPHSLISVLWFWAVWWQNNLASKIDFRV